MSLVELDSTCGGLQAQAQSLRSLLSRGLGAQASSQHPLRSTEYLILLIQISLRINHSFFILRGDNSLCAQKIPRVVLRSLLLCKL